MYYFIVITRNIYTNIIAISKNNNMKRYFESINRQGDHFIYINICIKFIINLYLI